MPQAVFYFERLRGHRIERLKSQGKTDQEIDALLPSVKLFPKFNRQLFNDILREENLKYDRDKRVRTAYSLRHSYISFRLMEGAEPLQIANNCGTSLQMIEEHYAAHIKDRLIASAINVMRPEAARESSEPPSRDGKQS